MISKYEVVILCGNTRVYEVEASNLHQAKRKAEEDYNNERTNWAEDEVRHTILGTTRINKNV